MAVSADQEPKTRTATRHAVIMTATAIIMMLLIRLWLYLSGSISFDSDEAILGLMARHIMSGRDFPLFFYGQRYMGALDAYLTVPLFSLFGQTVGAMRLLQALLYAGVIAVWARLSWRMSPRIESLVIMLVMMALPPVLITLYTASTLGNYVETLLFGGVLLLLGWHLIMDADAPLWLWLVSGLIAGLAWWSMALIVGVLLPLALVGLLHRRQTMPWLGIGVGLAGFLVGALPWWWGLLTSFQTTAGDLVSSRYGVQITFWERLFNLIFLNFTALVGLRPPWSVAWIALPVGILLLGVYGLSAWIEARGVFAEHVSAERQVQVGTLTGGLLVIPLLFLFTSFGVDPTGRYMLPLYPLLSVLVADAVPRFFDRNRVSFRAYGVPVLLVLIAGFNGWGVLRGALENPPGLSTQFDEVTRLPHEYDQVLIDFMDMRGITHAYSSYWVTFRFAFLTGDRLTFSPLLQDKESLVYTYGYDRYPAYTLAVLASENPAYISANLPELDARLRDRFDALGIMYSVEKVGPYTVFYDLSEHIAPPQLDIYSGDPGDPPSYIEEALR